jgi:predicted dehydrogenase
MTASPRTGPAGVGLIGAGVISTQYLENLTQFADVEVRFIADLDLQRAAAQAAAFGVAAYGSVAELLARDDVEIVVNLTVPAVHVEVGRQIIAAGKHVWSEKPLALDHASARELLAEASRAGLRVACAPDTVLGAGIQTALRAIARGDIGRPLTALTMFQVPGPDAWHPNPDFLFAQGAGPLLDIGPYYVTTLVQVFGSATRVHATASTARHTRTIATGPRAGEQFPVEVPTHHSALIEFVGGRSAQSTFSFQHALSRTGFVEINGTEGTVSLPDPNVFDGDTRLWRTGAAEPEVITAEGAEFGRGAGVVELARAIRAGEPERASGELAAHVLDILLGIRDAAEAGTAVTIESVAPPTAPLPENWDPRVATLVARSL